jgi:uncharacterized damage-inducible protein DinB
VKTDEIKLLYEYNYWADRRILTACAKVGPQQYVAGTSLGVAHGSLHATLIHILDAEWQWRLTCTGYYRTLLRKEEYDATELTEALFPTLEALVDRWQAEEKEMRAFLGGLDDKQLNRPLRYTTDSGSVRERLLWHCLFHAVNHGTLHRGEAAALLTGYGQSPGDFDFTLFLNEHHGLPS